MLGYFVFETVLDKFVCGGDEVIFDVNYKKDHKHNIKSDNNDSSNILILISV